MEQRYKRVRQQLDGLGYMQVLIPEALPLVEKLTADLIQTTASLQKYKKIAKNALEEQDNLQLGTEPYKCDNAKLVRECNDLHLAFIQFRERNEKTQKDLKRRCSTLEKEKLDCETECEKLRKRIRDLEFESAKKTDRILAFQNKNLQTGGKITSKSCSSAVSKSRVSTASKSNTEISTTMAIADHKIASLTKEIQNLKDEHLQLSEMTETYKNQLNNRDREIQRLNQMLEGGRPIQALNQDCCSKDFEAKLFRLEKEVRTLEKEKFDLETHLKESVGKQHEAMKRALHLAERNKQLEKELREIDQMALAVEADCNSTIKMNADKVTMLQDKIQDTILQIQSLEREVTELKRDKQELLSDLDALKLEKKHLQSILENALDEKKRLNDRINQFTVIEHDLNLEIDRLVQASAAQKRKIAELECRLVSGKLDAVSLTDRSEFPNESPTSSPTRVAKTQLPMRESKKLNKALPATLPKKTNKNSKKKAPKTKSGKSKHAGESSPPQKNPDNTPVSCVCTPNAGDYPYDNDEAAKRNGGCCSCCRCFSENKNKPANVQTEVDNSCCQCCPCMQRNDLLQKLHNSELSIANLQHENKSLAQEKHNLMTRLETARDRPEGDFDAFSLKSTVRRLERERDILKGDIVRLEEERDAVRHNLKLVSEKQSTEYARIEKALMNSEEEVKRLEQERRELMHTQGSRRATISGLEDQCETLKSQLQQCQTELNHQRSLYTQLKTLQEQTDKALGDSQGQLLQVETEITNYQNRIENMELENSQHNQIVDSLKNDIMIMKGNLAQMDAEKDALLIAVDDKTEKLALVEQDLRAKDEKIRVLEETVTDLKKRLSSTMDNTTARDKMLRSASAESASLRQELDSANRAKESAIHENRRLQDDLAACAADCRCARSELDVSKRQIEDLKRQLQHYVAEVKRFEDLMTQKEVERNELLDQFRSLSQEAELLENSNHTLENEATQSKVQLSVTLDHVTDLETKLTNQNGTISSYEKKIADLTSQVTNLESQLCHCQQLQERTEADLGSVRDLCMKLDKQKDDLVRELNEKEELKSMTDRDMLRLRRESETLQDTLTKDRRSVENLERLLSDARQESVQLRLHNQELDAEIQKLKQKIEELQNRLINTAEQLDFYQERALDFSQQNKQLRRDVANERFFRAKEEDGKRSPTSTTTTFTYSANIGTPDNKVCTFCGSCTAGNTTTTTTSPKNDKGNQVDTAPAPATASNRSSVKNDTRPEPLKPNGKSDVSETKISEWKSQQNKLPAKSSEGKKLSPRSESLQKQIRSDFSPSLTTSAEKKQTGSAQGSTQSRSVYSVEGDASYKAPTTRMAKYSSCCSGFPSYYNSAYKSSSSTDPQFQVLDSIKADSDPIKSSQCNIKPGQQACSQCNNADSKFRLNYKALLNSNNNVSKSNEVDCVCSKGCVAPVGSKYSPHCCIPKNK